MRQRHTSQVYREKRQKEDIGFFHLMAHAHDVFNEFLRNLFGLKGQINHDLDFSIVLGCR